MARNTENQSKLLINNMDRSLRENIIRLDQKLKGLRAEIDAKLQNSFVYEDNNSRDEYVKKLSTVSKEVTAAIKGIETLVNLVATDEDAEEQIAFLQGEGMQQFSEMIAESLEKITEIKTSF
ncbi:hypothetical protein [Legionella maioricensis]|uniref:Uncharacterized protein n=1 Tax=Legionella maioricensis TaxID=2896528 RepID=A0A9X2D2C2_9GAMM|nr:hypothetical protein [Legionella maioricensis]MCL9685168.1 hypothetical protein [Legionella maioricensis]MCL9688385.1 hypothetical protein [Legionella maioricensis]